VPRTREGPSQRALAIAKIKDKEVSSTKSKNILASVIGKCGRERRKEDSG
jgi:hypothetical protein